MCKIQYFRFSSPKNDEMLWIFAIHNMHLVTCQILHSKQRITNIWNINCCLTRREAWFTPRRQLLKLQQYNKQMNCRQGISLFVKPLTARKASQHLEEKSSATTNGTEQRACGLSSSKGARCFGHFSFSWREYGWLSTHSIPSHKLASSAIVLHTRVLLLSLKKSRCNPDKLKHWLQKRHTWVDSKSILTNT